MAIARKTEEIRRMHAISASVGAGQDRSAQALVEPARDKAGAFRRRHAGSYLRMARRTPGLWGMLVRSTNLQPPAVARKAPLAIDRSQNRRLVESVRDRRLDAILCMQFRPSHVAVASGLERTIPTYVIATNCGAHARWAVPGAAGHFLATEKVKAILAGFGMPGERILVMRIPKSPAFARRPVPAAIRREVEPNDDGRPVVLVMGWDRLGRHSKPRPGGCRRRWRIRPRVGGSAKRTNCWKSGWEVRADSVQALERKVPALQGDWRRQAGMRRRAGALARPRASAEILKRVLEE